MPTTAPPRFREIRGKADVLQLAFSDIHGEFKYVDTQNEDEMRKALDPDEGVWFDGSSIEGFARIEEADALLRPDPSTLIWLPDDYLEGKKVARIICDVYTPEGKPFHGDPRWVLRRQLDRAREMGFDFNVGPEAEFFLFKSDLDPHDRAGYFDLSGDKGERIRVEISDWLEEVGIEVEVHHHEVAPGQHEIDIRYGDALMLADRLLTYKQFVEKVAERHGANATFMPKPLADENGSGMHVHQSLFFADKEVNAFFDSDGKPFQLSDTAKQFLAGQLEHAKALAAVVAPTVNSYKRLIPGYEAPVKICWAQGNRSPLIRVPRVVRGGRACRLELRCPDPSANPYLAFAVMLAAGLDGIENQLALKDGPVEDNVYKRDDIDALPATLGKALEELKNDEVVLSALGTHVSENFIEGKMEEWREYCALVTEWEKDRYF